MSTSKRIDILCILAVIAAMAVTIGCMSFLPADAQGVNMAYSDRLFDTGRVHTIDIVMDDWQAFLDTCESETYTVCSVVIDGESFRNVGIRGKGNTSLSSVSSLGSDRYSFKIEFDQYTPGGNYYGLDKLSLNNMIYDNTMMKDYLVFQMMQEFSADAPLCSFVNITVNGVPFGLYLAIEGIESSFLMRNYGKDYGELYKPDTMNFGGGMNDRGKMPEFSPQDMPFMPTDGMPEDFDPTAFMPQDGMDAMKPGEFAVPSDESVDATSDTVTEGQQPSKRQQGSRGFSPGGMGSDSTRLQYIDDDPDSYSTIFSSAKTDITEADQQRLIRALKTLSNAEIASQAVDIDSLLRYFVVHNYAVNGDSYTGSMVHNYYLYEKDGMLSMLPWDYNLAFGTFQGSNASDSINDPIDTPLSTGSSDRPMFDWICENEQYLQMYHEYYAQFLEDVDIQKIINDAYELIRPYVETDPTKFCTLEEFDTAVSILKEFCRLRSESIQGQLDGSIPSTTQGQQEDASALIEADINTSDMGSMGGGMRPGGFGNDRGMDAAFPDGAWQPEESQAQTMLIPTQSQEFPADREIAEKPQRSFDMPTATQANTAALPTLLLCAVLLTGGVIFALCYKRRK